jgi:hypothetical protein
VAEFTSLEERVVQLHTSDSREIVGMASVGDHRLFVLRSPSHQKIEVYDTRTLELQQTLNIESLSDDSGGMTACISSNSLYVSDFGKFTIYKIQLSGDGNRISHWPVNGDPNGLSINSERNLLVVCQGVNETV